MSAAQVSLANLKALDAMLVRGDFDLVALGRTLLANPEWPLLVRRNRFGSLRPYDPQRAAQLLECAEPLMRERKKISQEN
jgi:2,4-dienoyl-CoA reductase-like NADH-dependent reductase (Old Yellow Enzyme family)